MLITGKLISLITCWMLQNFMDPTIDPGQLTEIVKLRIHELQEGHQSLISKANLSQRMIMCRVQI